MKQLPHSPLLVSSLALCGLLSACSQPTPNPDSAPIIVRNYDTTRGGVQITQIAYDQIANGRTGVADEYIVLQSDGTKSIHGWSLNAGDPGQDYDLPDTIFSKLYVYTHTAPDPGSKTECGLNLAPSKYIWNNSEPDTAILYDASSKMIDRLTYKP
jgi:hypothetical protein